MRVCKWLRGYPEDHVLVLIPTREYFSRSELAEVADYAEIPIPIAAFSREMKDRVVMYFNCNTNVATGKLNSEIVEI